MLHEMQETPSRRGRERLKQQRSWCFEPSYCHPPAVIKCLAPLECNDAYHRAMESTFLDDMSRPFYPSPPPVLAATDQTHHHLFGDDQPPAAVRRRPDAGGSCDHPQWSPSDCARPSSVDDFERTRRNVHGDELPSVVHPSPPADFNQPRQTILGPWMPPVCRHRDSTSPVKNPQFDRTKYNIVGPQSPPPLRFPVRPDDFVNSTRNIFGPNTAVPLRFPQRTCDFDDTSRNVFGQVELPFIGRPSLKPDENTYDDIFGRRSPPVPSTATPPPALRQNINVFSMTGRSLTPVRFQPRPECSFDRTYHHLFGSHAEMPVSSKRQYGKSTNTFRTVFGSEIIKQRSGKRQFTEDCENTFDTIFGRYEPPYNWEFLFKKYDTFENILGRETLAELQRKAELSRCH